jgi:hypothetical protein
MATRATRSRRSSDAARRNGPNAGRARWPEPPAGLQLTWLSLDGERLAVLSYPLRQPPQIGPRVVTNRTACDRRWARGSRGIRWPWDRLWASYPRLLALDGDEAHHARVQGEAEGTEPTRSPRGRLAASAARVRARIRPCSYCAASSITVRMNASASESPLLRQSAHDPGDCARRGTLDGSPHDRLGTRG